MRTELDTLAIARAILDALDAVIASEVSRTGSTESQTAERLARKARLLVDQAGMQALQEVG
jgi:hypothetical protein